MSARWTVVTVVTVALSSRLARAADTPPSTAAVTQLAVVAGSTCALHADGSVSCWGRDLDRSIKDAPVHRTPVGVPAFHDVVQLAGVASGICARHRDGTVDCLGMSPTSTSVPEVQPLKEIVDLRGACARGGDGRVACFEKTSWSPIANLDDAIDAEGEELTGCAIHKDTTVSCWSADDGAAKLVPGVTGAVQVGAGLFFGCARLRGGRVTCWGTNDSGELGRGAIDESASTFHAAAVVPGVTDAIDLMTGAAHACIRRKAGAMACWGELPWTGEKSPRVTAIKPLDHITAFAGGDQQCAAGRGREVWCLGTDRDGELGNGLSSIQEVPLAIPDVHDAIQIYATTLGTCAVRRTGAVTCWGEHGDGPGKLRAIQHLSESSRVFSGSYLTGLDTQGRLWIDGEDKPRKLPKGTTHSGPCVIANGGEVWCNANMMGAAHNPASGQLAGVTDAVEIAGSQSMVIRHRSGAVSTFVVDDALAGRAPFALPTIDDAIAIAAGSRVACAVRADRTIWCWGSADSPLLGHAPAGPLGGGGDLRLRPDRPPVGGLISIDTPPPDGVGGTAYRSRLLLHPHRHGGPLPADGDEVFYPMGFDDNGLPTERRVQQYYGVLCDPGLRKDPDFVAPQTPAKQPVAISRPDFIALCSRLAGEDEKVFENLWRPSACGSTGTRPTPPSTSGARRTSQLGFLHLLAAGHTLQPGGAHPVGRRFPDGGVPGRDGGEGSPRRLSPVAVRPGRGRRPAGTGDAVTIETTRPELLAACVALVAHPNDDRYRALFGSEVLTPLFRVRGPGPGPRAGRPREGLGDRHDLHLR